MVAGDFKADQLSSNCNGSKVKRKCQTFNFRFYYPDHKDCGIRKYSSSFDFDQ